MNDQETLDSYRAARDVLIASIEAGHNIVELQIRGKRQRVSDPIEELKHVEKLIQHYERRVSAAQHGRTRNLANIRRR